LGERFEGRRGFVVRDDDEEEEEDDDDEDEDEEDEDEDEDEEYDYNHDNRNIQKAGPALVFHPPQASYLHFIALRPGGGGWILINKFLQVRGMKI